VTCLLKDRSLSKTKTSPRTSIDDSLVTALFPIARYLIRAGVGVGDLIRAVKRSYVRAAIQEIPRRGERPNISRLSVATGLTRKEVSELLHTNVQEKTNRRSGRQEHRALRVARGWMNDPRYQDLCGKPAALEMKGASRSFVSLVRTYAGDVTAVSVLRELERMNIVWRTSSGKLKLNVARAARRCAGSQEMQEFAKLLGDLVSSVAAFSSKDDRTRFFAFREAAVPSPDTAALFQRTFSRRAAILLNGIDQWVKSQELHRSTKKRRTPTRGIRVGLGVYVFQEPPTDSAERSNKELRRSGHRGNMRT